MLILLPLLWPRTEKCGQTFIKLFCWFEFICRIKNATKWNKRKREDGISQTVSFILKKIECLRLLLLLILAGVVCFPNGIEWPLNWQHSSYSPPVSLVLLNPRFKPEKSDPPISTIPLPALTTASAPCFACTRGNKEYFFKNIVYILI